MSKCEDYVFLINGTLYSTIINELDDYFKFLHNKKIVVNKNNSFTYSNMFILDHYKYFYNQNKSKYDIKYKTVYPNSFINLKYMKNLNINKYPEYEDITLNEYINLLKNIIIMVDECFNIPYELTCPLSRDEELDIKSYKKDINENGLLTCEQIYCKYTKITHKNGNVELFPLFVGSFGFPGNSVDTLFIYNICSNISLYYKHVEELNEDGNNIKMNKYESKNILNDMINLFKYITQRTTIGLTLETSNPSFAKAFNLYYSCGFKPIFNILETENIDYIGITSGCVQVNPMDPGYHAYMKCVEKSLSKMLMMFTYDPNKTSLLNYSDNFTFKNTFIKRNSVTIPYFSNISCFYDFSLAMAFRCSCILDTYYRKNKIICDNIVKKLDEYFTINNNENKNIIDIYGFNIYNFIDSYKINVNQPSFNSQHLRNVVNKYESYYRFINVTSKNLNNYNDYHKSPSSKVHFSMYKINFVIKEIDPINIRIRFSINDPLTKNVIETSKYYDINKNYDWNTIKLYNILESELINIGFNLKILSKIIDYNVLKNDLIIFKSNITLESNVNSMSNYVHAVSIILNNKDKEFYFYDPQSISDRLNHKIIYNVKCLVSLFKLIFKHGGIVLKDNTAKDLSRYKHNNESIYAKIQNDYADDDYGSLCLILSNIPYIAMDLYEESNEDRNILNHLQFYNWFIHFSSIIMKQRLKRLNQVTGLQSNIFVTFPYIYLGMDKLIDNFNKIKSLNMNVTAADNKIKDEMYVYNEELSNNLYSIKNNIYETFYSDSEFTSIIKKLDNNKISGSCKFDLF
jgi:hypothetical protein